MSFADGSRANQWAVVSDLGGIAEIDATCPGNGGPFGPDSTFCDAVLQPTP